MFNTNKAFSGFSVDDIPTAKTFYATTLGMHVSENNGMLEIEIANGSKVLAYPKPNHMPATFTILNFPVSNIEQVIDELTARGVQFEIYAGFGQDAKGISRGLGPNIAWFKDPAGNILSLIEET